MHFQKQDDWPPACVRWSRLLSQVSVQVNQRPTLAEVSAYFCRV